MSELQTYINMNAKAIEVQKLHKPAVCDRYVCACEACRKNIKVPHYIQDYDMDHLNKRDLTNVYEPYAKMVRDADTCTFVAFYNERHLDEWLSYIWLPTQAQLQDMIGEGFIEKYGLKGFISFFGDFADESEYMDNGNDKRFTSMEQLWLAFVMKEKFNKIWDGEEWILQ